MWNAQHLLLFLVGATMPIEGTGTFHVAGYPVGPAKATTAVLLIYIVISWLFTGQRLPWNGKHLWIALFAFMIGIGNILGGLKGQAISAVFVLWTSYLAVFLFYFLVPWTVQKRRDLEVLMSGLVAGVILSVGIGVLRPGSFTRGGRFTGTAENPNDLAFSLAVLAPVALSLFFTIRSPFRKLLVGGALAVAVSGILLSLSRTAFVCVGAMGGLYLLRYGGIGSFRYLLPVVVLAGGVILMAPQSFQDRITTFTTEEGRLEDSSIQMRLAEYYYGTRAFASHPILGVGERQFGEYAHEQNPAISEQHVIHNVYLGVAAEFGLMGLVPLLAAVVLTWLDFGRVRRLRRIPALRRDPELALLVQRATFFQIAFLGCVVGQQFAPFLRAKEFWLLMGLSSALVAMARQHIAVHHPERLRRPALGGADGGPGEAEERASVGSTA